MAKRTQGTTQPEHAADPTIEELTAAYRLSDPAMVGAITFYSISCYTRYEALAAEQIKAAACFCMEWSLKEPLWLRGKNNAFPTADIPEFGRRSSIYAIAVMASSLIWRRRQGKNEVPADVQALVKTSSLLHIANDAYEMFLKGMR